MSKSTGACPVCTRTYELNLDGNLRKHWKRDGQGKGLPFSDPCDGSYGPPTADTTRSTR